MRDGASAKGAGHVRVLRLDRLLGGLTVSHSLRERLVACRELLLLRRELLLLRRVLLLLRRELLLLCRELRTQLCQLLLGGRRRRRRGRRRRDDRVVAAALDPDLARRRRLHGARRGPASLCVVVPRGVRSRALLFSRGCPRLPKRSLAARLPATAVARRSLEADRTQFLRYDDDKTPPSPL